MYISKEAKNQCGTAEWSTAAFFGHSQTSWSPLFIIFPMISERCLGASRNIQSKNAVRASAVGIVSASPYSRRGEVRLTNHAVLIKRPLWPPANWPSRFAGQKNGREICGHSWRARRGMQRCREPYKWTHVAFLFAINLSLFSPGDRGTILLRNYLRSRGIEG